MKISRQLRAILLLPFVVVGIIPSLLMLITAGIDTHWDMSIPVYGLIFFIGLLMVLLGMILLTATVFLFSTVGQGTPAPWDPPTKLVVEGPYRYTRSPMIVGVLAVLFGESVLTGSWVIFLWTVFFFTLNHVYFILSEEPGLVKRFGESYRKYKQHVPRWIPRITPWQGDEEISSEN
jgi:protein-S-isoprenylcysteine O-methyltransferase Ste14